MGIRLRRAGSDVAGRDPHAPPRLAILIIVALISLLAACGHVTAGEQSVQQSVQSGSPSAASTPTARVGTAAYNGCPAQQAPADAGSFKPDMIVSQNPQSASSAQPIALVRGQRLEIRLEPMVQWQLNLSDPDHTLANSASEGWYDGTLKACIWHFTAIGTGSAQLNYSGPVVCPPLKLCPAVEQELIYHVSVR